MFLKMCGLFLFFLSFGHASPLVTAPTSDLFVPMGFDDNDSVELILKGTLPHPCFSREKVDVKIRGKKIFIEALAQERKSNDPSDETCRPLKVSFHEKVYIGKDLKAGTYDVILNQGTQFEVRDRLEIAEAPVSYVDNYLYAMVDYIELGFTGGLTGTAFLVGKAASNCLELDEVKFVSNDKNALSILPVMKRVRDDCNEAVRPLVIPIKFDLEQFSQEQILLYSRSLDGGSVYNFIER